MASGSNKPKKEIVMMALASLLLLFAIALSVMQFNNIRNLRSVVEEEEIAVMQARTILNQRLEHRDNARMYEERIHVLELLMPETPQEEQIIRYLDHLAVEHELKMQQISFGGRVENEEAGYVRMPLSIQIEGRYQNLIKILTHLYEGARAVRVDNVAISLSATPEQPANIMINISASAFYSLD